MEKEYSPQSPSEFYRNRRPEYFSDSLKTQQIQLPREQFAFELNQISTNQKQDAFETFCRRLAEKLIAPNLIPQVGPTGGGDGKTDFETYPISNVLSDRWFVPDSSWRKDENWAFAISAKEDWKSKVKSDVKKIVETGRGYTKIYFISNQTISSKKKKDCQDELKAEFGIEVIILDAEWIIEKTYNNNFINLAVDSLNLSGIYKVETLQVGSNDAARIELLEELENKISCTNRYFDYDYQLVEDALKVAIVSRMLEKPRDEVIGKFERALRVGLKVNNKQQLSRIHYQMAWTYIHWYDDYKSFIQEFNLFKTFVIARINIDNLECYTNLMNILRSISHQGNGLDKTQMQKEEDDYLTLLDQCILDNEKPATAATARTYKVVLSIFNNLYKKKEVSNDLHELTKCFQESIIYLDYRFENFKPLVEMLGELLPNDSNYDKLFDVLAKISENRASELSSGKMFITRAYQKLERDFSKESLIYFGKAILKLAKAESQDELYFALRGIASAYRNLGLVWAANNATLAATNITIKEWYNEGRLSKRLLHCIEDATKNEAFIGRIPHVLVWHELLKIIVRQFEQEETEENEIPTLNMVDATLSIRLLNSNYSTWKQFSYLPDIFKKEELLLAEDTVLYMLGYVELVSDGELKDLPRFASIDKDFNALANQPFKRQIVHETNLLNSKVIEFRSVILGTQFIVKFDSNVEYAIYAEMILAYLESFLATSFTEIYPSSEIIFIELKENSEGGNSVRASENDKLYTVQIGHSDDPSQQIGLTGDFMLELFAKILAANFIIKGEQEYLEKLFKIDEVHERVSIIMSHRIFYKNVFGDSPKLFLKDWISDSTKEYIYKRLKNPIVSSFNEREPNNSIKSTKPNVDNVKHNQTKVASIINAHLWDQAKWKGFGFFTGGGFSVGMCLAFENEHAGREIFAEWKHTFGDIDKDDLINISIVKGVDANNPFWYRVHISKKMTKGDLREGQFLVSTSRIHEMNAIDPTNVNNLVEGFKYVKKYLLCPAKCRVDGTIVPITELGIEKASLTIRYAWEIGENDLDAVVIRANDNPYIPADKLNAPVINLLKLRKEQMDDR